MRLLAAFLLLLFSFDIVFASTEPDNEPRPDSTWKAEAELGYVKTGGNTQTESTNFKANVENIRHNWRYSLRFETLRNADSSGTTAEKYLVNAKSAYNLSPVSYLFGRLQYEDDRFSGYDYQASAVIGYGYRLYNTAIFKWEIEAGPGRRENRLEEGTRSAEALLYLGSDLGWQLGPTARLTEEMNIEAGEDRTISKSVTGLKTQINSSLASKISYTVRHNSAAPAGKKKTDTELGVSLVYTF